jgi:mono/diheme cytochrome c family protein
VRAPLLALLAAAAAFLAAGCGTVGKVPAGGDLSTGKRLFVEKCASCHTLAEANAKGQVGPNLDDAIGGPRSQGFEESTLRDMVRGQIAYATFPMPRDLVTGNDADAVASYIVQVAGKPGTSVSAGTAPAETQQSSTSATTTTESTTTEATTTSGGGETATQGKAIFVAKCGTCHTLAAAGTSGTVGPNLDELKPDAARVAKQVENGGTIMPAFKSELSDAEIQAVADYVASSAGK